MSYFRFKADRMKRELQGRYVTISTVGEKVRAFVSAPLPPRPFIVWTPELRSKSDQALLALGRLDNISTLLPDTSLFLYMCVRKEAVLSSMIEGTQSSLSDLLLFELNQEPGVPLAHMQFETIHPFLDGNGRLGRLLITLLLCEQKVLREPMLYLSLYFKTHRQYYYELLNSVRVTGDWEAWLDFFAEAVIVTATQAVKTAQQLLNLSNQDHDKISGLGRAAASTLQVHRALMEHPIATSSSLVKKTGITPATVNKALGHLAQLGIVKELTARKRNRLFSYAGYIEIMNLGTELPFAEPH